MQATCVCALDLHHDLVVEQAVTGGLTRLDYEPLPPRRAATDGCTPELITGWQIAVATTLKVNRGQVTVRCTVSTSTPTTETVLLTVTVRYNTVAELNQAYDSVIASINAGTFVKAVTGNLPPAGESAVCEGAESWHPGQMQERNALLSDCRSLPTDKCRPPLLCLSSIKADQECQDQRQDGEEVRRVPG